MNLIYPLLLVLAPEAAPPPPLAPDLRPLVLQKRSELTDVVRRYEADRDSLHRTYPILSSPTRHARLSHFTQQWHDALDKLASEKLTKDAQGDLVTLKKTVVADRQELEDLARTQAEIAPLLPFAATLIGFEETRRRFEPVNSMKAAGTLTTLTKELNQLPKAVKPTPRNARRAVETLGRLRTHVKNWYDFYNGYDPLFTWWLAEPYKEVDEALGRYATFLREKGKEKDKAEDKSAAMEVGLTAPPAPRTERDVPDLAELIATPRSEMEMVLRRYQGDRGRRPGGGGGVPGRGGAASDRSVRATNDWLAALGKLDFDKLSLDGQVDYLMLRNVLQRELARTNTTATPPARPKDPTGIVGRPIGREALLVELKHEMIPYSPEELVAIAEKEFAWCEAEMKKATQEMGFSDWKQALEKVKTLHVEPGKQPAMIRDLAHEAVAYLRKHDLVSLPPIAVESWRMEMMSPRRQLTSPFFTGGEVITVSYPTNTMAHDAKLQSMRGNNLHFSRATVHHELIPGHHLQGYVNQRYKGYRGAFSTPFWIEGWALYWELVLYKKGFPEKPEDRVGFLFWRMHRCARIVFSLGFHLGKMSPQECVDLLVDRVGHERDNATAEVRRSFGGGYGPLYQAAYLLGGMQLRALREELVDTGKMSERAFHDAILKENRIPIAMVRALLTKQKLTRDYVPDWRFAGEVVK